jgi:hypothetical protein
MPEYIFTLLSFNHDFEYAGAGMECVMVPDKRMFSTPEHIPQGVTKVLKSLEDFVPEEFGLPSYL